MIDLNQLNEWERRFAEALFKKYPEWKELAKIVKDEKNRQTCLAVEVSAPGNNMQGPLYIYTYPKEGEIVIGFDYYHNHLADQEKALAFLEKILNEKILALSWWNDDEFCNAWSLDKRLSHPI